jgi:hypothetical protein
VSVIDIPCEGRPPFGALTCPTNPWRIKRRDASLQTLQEMLDEVGGELLVSVDIPISPVAKKPLIRDESRAYSMCAGRRSSDIDALQTGFS